MKRTILTSILICVSVNVWINSSWAGDDAGADLRATVHVNTDIAPKSFNPMIFGGFLEHFNKQIYNGIYEPDSPLSNEHGFRKDVIEAMKELKLSVVRWPGGCFASGYHWKEGVGDDRKPVDDMAWGVIESNEFGTDEFIQWCRDVGCVPFICNNAGNGTISEMVDWLEYCNETSGEYAELRKKNGHPKPLNVPIWSIGNENWGGHEIGAKTIGEWEPLVLEAAKKMKAVDPEIKLSVAATRNESWTLPLLKTAGDYLDYVSVHGYWFPFWGKNEMPDYLTCIMHSQDPENHISDVIRILDKAGHRGNIKIAFDEWNLRGWHHPGFPRKKVSDYDNQEIKNLVQARDINLIDSQYTMADALFTASFFNASLRHAEDVGMANIAPIVNTRGPLHVYPKGIVKRTTFHVMAMYANLLGSRVGAANIKSGMLVHGDKRIPVVDAISTVDESGMLWSIALINRHPTEVVDCTVKFKDELLDGSFGATLLSGDSPEAFNDIEHSNRVVPENKSMIFQNGVVKLPPHSLSIIKLSIK